MSNRAFILAAVALIPPCTVIAQDAIDPGTRDQTQPIEAIAQPDAWSPGRMTVRDFTLYWENDGTLVNTIDDTDRYYTNGAGIELSFDPNFTPSIRDWLAPAGEWDDPRFGVGVAIKQRIYTGIDISDPNPAPDDHPYAGYLYLALSLQRADETKHDHFELDLGLVGPGSGAETFQKFIHDVFPEEIDPQGWDEQLDNEPTINFNFQRTWKSKPANIAGVQMEMLPAAGFDLGTVSVKARAKMTLRAGMNLPSDFGPATLLGHKDHTVPAGASVFGEDGTEHNWSFYLYASAQVEAIAHDIILDGNVFETSRSVSSEPFVALATVGAVLRYKHCYFGYAQNFQSETFENQVDGQAFGTLVLGASFNF